MGGADGNELCLQEPLDVTAVLTDIDRCAAVGPIEVEKSQPRSVGLGMRLFKLCATAVRARNLATRNLIRPVLVHLAPKTRKEAHGAPFLTHGLPMPCMVASHSHAPLT